MAMPHETKRWVGNGGIAVLLVVVALLAWSLLFDSTDDAVGSEDPPRASSPQSSPTPAEPPTPSVEPSPTTAASVGPQPPVRPPDVLSDDGAAAFLQYWVEALNWSTATMDVGPLEAASSPACGLCQGIILETKEDLAAGRHYEDGIYTIRLVSVQPLKDGNDPEQRKGVVLVDSGRFLKYNPDGSVFRQDPPARDSQLSFTIRLGSDGKWRATAFYLITNDGESSGE